MAGLIISLLFLPLSYLSTLPTSSFSYCSHLLFSLQFSPYLFLCYFYHFFYLLLTISLFSPLARSTSSTDKSYNGNRRESSRSLRKRVSLTNLGLDLRGILENNSEDSIDQFNVRERDRGEIRVQVLLSFSFSFDFLSFFIYNCLCLCFCFFF